MEQLKPIRLSELADLTEKRRDAVSKFFKNFPEKHLIKVGMRIVGVHPEAATEYLMACGYKDFLKPSITLSANLCGGVGKTTSILNLGVCTRRLVTRNVPIVYIDCDSQGSLTKMISGERAKENEPILLDYFDGISIKELLYPVSDNCWLIKSHLGLASADKYMSATDVIFKMFEFYKDLFNFLGNNAKIFQDHTPQLTGIFASSIFALHKFENQVIKNIILPIRSDDFAIQGGKLILKEMQDIKRNFNNSIPVTCFFSNVDKRISTTEQAVILAKNSPEIAQYLSGSEIRYSSEIPKAIMKHTSVFNGKNNHAAQDYQKLCKSMFFKDVSSWKQS